MLCGYGGIFTVLHDVIDQSKLWDHDLDQDQQYQDQNCQRTVSRGLEAKTTVSRTTQLSSGLFLTTSLATHTRCEWIYTRIIQFTVNSPRCQFASVTNSPHLQTNLPQVNMGRVGIQCYQPNFLLCTQHCRHVCSLKSGVFNFLKFDHIWKKERKKEKRLFTGHCHCVASI